MARFTVDQLEWIRKLRSSGLLLDQVVQAWQRMDAIDREDQEKLTPQRHPIDNVQVTPLPSISSASPARNLIKNGEISIEALNPSAAMTNTPSISKVIPRGSISQSTEGSQSSKDSFDCSSENLSQSSDIGNELDIKLREYKSRLESEVAEEIKSFVLRHNIRQQMVADMARISQGYVSKFFRGEGSEMSERSKNQIIMWYLKNRDSPARIFEICGKDPELYSCNSIQTPLSNSPQSVPGNSLSVYNPSNTTNHTQLHQQQISIAPLKDLYVYQTPTQVAIYSPEMAANSVPLRRDRFIFRAQHLEILESHFKRNEYPDQFTKEQIAYECNEAVEFSTGRVLNDKDRVSLAVVSNWFNNKRKERKSKVATPPTGHRGRGRPPNSSRKVSNHTNDSMDEILSIAKKPRSESTVDQQLGTSVNDFSDFDYESNMSLSDIKVEDVSNGDVVDDETNYNNDSFRRFISPVDELVFKDTPNAAYSRGAITGDVHHTD